MLVLGRATGEKIIVGNITIMVVESRDGRAQIGIDAPRDVKIWREEVLNAKRRDGEHV